MGMKEVFFFLIVYWVHRFRILSNGRIMRTR